LVETIVDKIFLSIWLTCCHFKDENKDNKTEVDSKISSKSPIEEEI
jgi:hypothetical protein